jgi:hypothetical protein
MRNRLLALAVLFALIATPVLVASADPTSPRSAAPQVQERGYAWWRGWGG